MPLISPQRVTEIFEECLAHGEQDCPTITAVGIAHTAHFACRRLEQRKQEIGQMLAQLPTPFQPRDRGGDEGWSFLNACNDREGAQWTGFHVVMERLLLLGLATKQAQFCLDRELWEVFPGAMPYFQVLA